MMLIIVKKCIPRSNSADKSFVVDNTPRPFGADHALK